jgi:nucleoside-diphosphate-sugar epimerase
VKVLVTGATGFVGRELCPALTQNGWVVRGTLRQDNSDRLPEVEWIQVTDIAMADWTALLRECHYVVHLAALAHQIGSNVSAAEFDRVNHRATAELARAVNTSPTVRRLVYVSSIGAVCSASDHIVSAETECRPESPYGRSKRAAELAIQSILAETLQDWCIIRPTLVYGPGNPGNMRRLMQLTRSPVPLPLASIRNRRTFLYVGNLVDLINKALTHPNASRQIFNVADSQVLSTPELIRQLAELCGSRARLISAPLWILRLLGRMGDLLSRTSGRSLGIDTYSVERLLGSLEVDNSFVRTKLGWNPPFTTREGLQRTMSVSGAALVEKVQQRAVALVQAE